MRRKLTSDDLDRIEARAAASSVCDGEVWTASPKGHRFEQRMSVTVGRKDADVVAMLGFADDPDRLKQTLRDAEFFASARADVLALVAELRERGGVSP